MKYFPDFEFIEGFHKPLFGRRRHFIDMVSIGIYAEDGRRYYAISNEFDPKKADKWVRDNVLYPIMTECGFSKNLSNLHGCLEYSESAIKDVQRHYGKSNAQISKEIVEFINYGLTDVIAKITRADCWHEPYYPKEFEYIKRHNTFIPDALYSSGVDGSGYERNAKIIYNQPEFYGYYSDYDWVLFCSLFGRMIDLPKGFPMYCRDLKQTMDEKAWDLVQTGIGTHTEGNKWYADNFEAALKWIKDHPNYPKNNSEHNASADAKWNYDLYNFLVNL